MYYDDRLDMNLSAHERRKLSRLSSLRSNQGGGLIKPNLQSLRSVFLTDLSGWARGCYGQ